VSYPISTCKGIRRVTTFQTTWDSRTFPRLFQYGRQSFIDKLFNSRCFTLIKNKTGSHCNFRIQHLMHCGCGYLTELTDNNICVIGSLTVRRNWFQFPWLFPDQFEIPRLSRFSKQVVTLYIVFSVLTRGWQVTQDYRTVKWLCFCASLSKERQKTSYCLLNVSYTAISFSTHQGIHNYYIIWQVCNYYRKVNVCSASKSMSSHRNNISAIIYLTI